VSIGALTPVDQEKIKNAIKELTDSMTRVSAERSLVKEIVDKIEEETQIAKHLGVFGATFITFFLAEMGDKTQIATIALAAHYAAPFEVVVGTTLGMLIADVPAVFVGNKFAARIPMKLVHSIAAAIFAVMGVLTLIGIDQLMG
jgi:putative Ca2+/H+ antiporter (TMEM165/GDT1 family)